MKITSLFFSDDNLNDCALTDFDLTKIDLDITMHHCLVGGQRCGKASPTDPKYVCFEKLDIVMDDDKITTYSKVPIDSGKIIEDAIYEPSQKPKIHYAKMLPYMNYPSNSLLLSNKYLP